MAAFPKRAILGRSGLEVGPLGVAGGYGIDEKSLLAAFEQGANYWYHGSMRKKGMTAAIRRVVASGQRERLALVLQSYSRWPWLLERTFLSALRSTKADYADVLLLGWYNGPPSERVLERAASLKERGLVRHIAVSGHHRPAFVEFAANPTYSLFHVRYNAAHTGAERDVFPHLATEGRPGFVAYTATRWGKLLRPSSMPPGEPPLRGRDCYRFVLSNPNFQVCMTGPANAEQLQEALTALAEGPLTPEEDERIRRIGAFVRGGA